MIRFLSSSSQCHLALASRGCSKSITLLFPKEWLFLLFLRDFDILATFGKEVCPDFMSYMLPQGFVFHLEQLARIPEEFCIHLLKHHLDEDGAGVSLLGDICEIHCNQHLFPREPSTFSLPLRVAVPSEYVQAEPTERRSHL